ncbi:MAG: tyrosine-type recombinase/integrase [archaeon]
MVEDDIYKNKLVYERFRNNLKEFLDKPLKNGKRGERVYYCKNPKNLEYFEKFFDLFEAKDLSYIHRLRILGCFKLVCHATNKDLKECEREDINKIVAFMHTRYNSPKSKGDFIKILRYSWKTIFPEKDIKGRSDDTIIPYVVRHLSAKMDKSKDRLKRDKLDFEEYERLIKYFDKDPRMQAYLTLAVESLGRPQEIMYTKINDLEIYDSYAKIWISEHGKEGCGFLQCIDSFPYLLEWLKVHPFKTNKDSYLFVSIGKKNEGSQMTPYAANKQIRFACKKLGIDKPVTCYSLKRNGVTFRRLKGDSDTQIQHAARWTSTKQLKTYDMSDQEDALKIELVKRGKLQGSDSMKKYEPSVKKCVCGAENGFSDEFCSKCMRPMDREKEIVKENFMEIPEIKELFLKIGELKGNL